MVHRAGSTLWMHILIFLACYSMQTCSYSVHVRNPRQTLSLHYLRNVTAFVYSQYKSNVNANGCHPKNLSGFSGNISESACTFSKYLNTIQHNLHASEEIIKYTKSLRKQFNDFIIAAFNPTCDFSTQMDLDKKELGYKMKCLSLQVLESLGQWLKKIEPHKRQRNYRNLSSSTHLC